MYRAIVGPDGPSPHVQRLADGAVIPAVEGNRDYVEYLAWVAGGGVLEAAAPISTKPTLRLGDQRAALLAAVDRVSTVADLRRVLKALIQATAFDVSVAPVNGGDLP